MTLEILQPDDWHVHFRDDLFLPVTVPATARVFARAVAMPNLKPPITEWPQAKAYRERLQQQAKNASFEPLVTVFLRDQMDLKDLEVGVQNKVYFAGKLYPANATTHSQDGVVNPLKLNAVYKKMSELGLPLLIHGEVITPETDVFDREAQFIEHVLKPLVDRYPDLKIVLEHITTLEAVKFVRSLKGRVGATITPHHMLLNRNALFNGGLRPHYYCLPVLKREMHREALCEAATSGEPWFFFGSDSAPHLLKDKASACGCAGVYNAPYALELCAEVFAAHKCLDRLEGFVSRYGAKFYGLPLNTRKVELRLNPSASALNEHTAVSVGQDVLWAFRPTLWQARLL